jgi:hypothetical protein
MTEARAVKPWLRFLAYGLGSVVCYGLLFVYLNNKAVIGQFVRTDGWYPLLPVVTAFVFSFFHGAFTGYFWEVLGVTAKMPKPVARKAIDEAEGSED